MSQNVFSAVVVIGALRVNMVHSTFRKYAIKQNYLLPGDILLKSLIRCLSVTLEDTPKTLFMKYVVIKIR